MRKILLVLNGISPFHLIDAAISIAQTTSSRLHAVFMNYELNLAEYNYPFPNDLSLTRNNLTGKTIAEEDIVILEDNIKLFREKCQTAKVDASVEPGNDISLGELRANSAFSDFILTDGNQCLSQYHVADLLSGAHCPVYLVSRDVGKVENITLTYDASFSSVYAIKMFSYLFPDFQDLPVRLVHIASERTNELPQERNIIDWISVHYSNFQTKKLFGNVRTELVNYISSIPGTLVVMGSYGRNAVSRFFHKSLANAVIEDGRSSLFMAHE